MCGIYIDFETIFLGCIPAYFSYNYRVFVVVLKRFLENKSHQQKTRNE